MTEQAPAPDGLTTAGRALWDSIAEQVAEDDLELDRRELRILRDAAKTADDLAVIEAALLDAPTTVVGSTGQPVPNRLFDEARKNRALIAALLKQLVLEDSTERGRRGHSLTSSTARAAASIRWHGAEGMGPTS